MNQSAIGKAAKKLLIYVGLALAALVAIGVLAAISIATRTEFTGGWIGLIVYTSLLLWVVISKSRLHWRSPRFWLTTLGLLTIHILVFVIILRSYPQWRMIWFLPVVIGEAGLFAVVLDFVLGPPKKRRIHKRRSI